MQCVFPLYTKKYRLVKSGLPMDELGTSTFIPEFVNGSSVKAHNKMDPGLVRQNLNLPYEAILGAEIGRAHV